MGWTSSFQEIMKLSIAHISEIYCSWTVLSAVSVGKEWPQWKENTVTVRHSKKGKDPQKTQRRDLLSQKIRTHFKSSLVSPLL